MRTEGNNVNTLVVALAIIPYIIPNGFQTFWFMPFFYFLKYISLIIVLLLTIGKKIIIKPVNELIASVCIFSIAMIVTSVLCGIGVFDGITRMFNYLLPVLWINYMLQKCEKRVLHTLICYYGVLAVINCLIAVANPNGIVATQSSNKTFLLGIDNKMVFTLLPMLGIALFYIERFANARVKKRNSILAVVVFSSSLFAVWAVNAMMAVLLMLFLIFLDGIGFKRLLTLRNGLIAIAGICVLVVFSTYFSQGIFADFITNVLHKEVTFSGRTVLWAQAISLIYQSPIIGYGVGAEVSNNFYFWSNGSIISGFSSHNGYLRLMLEGGIVALVTYILIYIVLYRACRPVWTKNKGVRILTYCIIGLLLSFVFEAEYISTQMLFVMGMIYYYARSNKTLGSKREVQ